MAAICETVTASTMAELCAARDAVVDADLVELRLDGVRDVDVARALAGRRLPAIVTCRPQWEGGRYDGDETTRLHWLGEAMRLGAEYVDVEWRADRRALPAVGSRQSKIVLSHHDFDGVPSDLGSRIHAMRGEQPDVLKVAVTARRLTDVVTLRDQMRGNAGRDQVAIAMGAPGQVTRLMPAAFRSCWTYAGTAAPGQTPARDLVHCYRVRATTADTAMFGVAGAPLGHSASPAMHNAAFDAVGLDAVYVPFETADASELFDVAGALGVRGLSVTAPLKRAAFERAGTRDEDAARAGAANTLRRAGDGWDAANFNLRAFLAPLERRQLAGPGTRATVLGAGGAARAVVAALVGRGVAVRVSARRTHAAEQLARDMGATSAPWPPPVDWDLLVNATPVGAWPASDASPVDPAHVTKGAVVYDLVYNPADTALLQGARAAGAATIGGLDMLVEQAVCQFEWWTGHPAPREVMIGAALSFIRTRAATATTL